MNTHTPPSAWGQGWCQGKCLVEPAGRVPGQGLSGQELQHTVPGTGAGARLPPATLPLAGTPGRLAWPTVLGEGSQPSHPPCQHSPLPDHSLPHTAGPRQPLGKGWRRTALLVWGCLLSTGISTSPQPGPAGCKAGLPSPLLMLQPPLLLLALPQLMGHPWPQFSHL